MAAVSLDSSSRSTVLLRTREETSTRRKRTKGSAFRSLYTRGLVQYLGARASPGPSAEEHQKNKMDPLVILARILHVVLGIFWGGVVLFNVFFLMPAIRDAGPDGNKVMGALVGRGLMKAMPTAAILTILSGLWLYWRVSGGFQPEYMGSAVGMTYGTGGGAAILAYAIGMIFVRPNMTKAVQLSQAAAKAGQDEREQMLARAQSARQVAGVSNNAVTVLLIVAILAMAVGRYLV